MIETSQMQTLVAVAKAGSFSKAAEELNVTQSAISQSIKNLENKIGVDLFNRSGKKIILTPEGEKLFYLGQSFLDEIESTLTEIKYDKNSMSGKIRIGTLNGVGKSWLAPEVLNLAKEFPELKISLTLEYAEDLVRKFENRQLDFLVLPEEVLPSSGEKVYLGEEKSTLVYPDSPEFDLQESPDYETLSKLPTILFEDRDPLYQMWFKETFGKVPPKINSRFIINSHGSMLQAVHDGLGIAVVPTHVFVRAHRRKKIKNLSGKYMITNYKFFLVYHKESMELLRIKNTLDRIIASDNKLSADL